MWSLYPTSSLKDLLHLGHWTGWASSCDPAPVVELQVICSTERFSFMMWGTAGPVLGVESVTRGVEERGVTTVEDCGEVDEGVWQ